MNNWGPRRYRKWVGEPGWGWDRERWTPIAEKKAEGTVFETDGVTRESISNRSQHPAGLPSMKGGSENRTHVERVAANRLDHSAIPPGRRT